MVTTTPQLANKNPIMQVQGLIREFPAGEDKIRVLHGVDLTIYQGEMVAIIGQSGSGKSTLMNILGCLDQPSAGSYCIYGKPIDQLSADELAQLRREHFGFIFQRYHLLGDMVVVQKVGWKKQAEKFDKIVKCKSHYTSNAQPV